MNDYEIKRECETRFQNGGPRVYFYDDVRSMLLPSNTSAKRTASDMRFDPGMTWARRFNRATHKYEWVKVPYVVTV